MSTSSHYLSLQPSYTIDLNKGHQQEPYDPHQVVLPSFSLSPVYSKKPVQDQIGYSYMGSQLQPSPYRLEAGGDFGSRKSGSYDQTSLDINKGSANRPKLKFTICKKEEQVFGGSGVGGEFNSSSTKWPPLRLVTKGMRGDGDQKQQLPPSLVETENRNLISNTPIGGSPNTTSSNNSDNTTIRVCSDCNTTKTPLWRSGPRGPKSLCNACGIRQRKARRAMAAAANGSLVPNCMSGSTIRAGNGLKKASNNKNNGIGSMKKRSKIVKPARQLQHNGAQRKLCFEKFALNLSKQLSLQQVFPKEEKEAAILLMALSCGLVR